MKTLIFANQKGGVGKTTSCLATCIELSKKYKVLAIDGDPQCNFSFVAKREQTQHTLEDVMQKKLSINEVIERVDVAPFDFISCSWSLADSDRRFTKAFDYVIFKKALETIKNNYDFCVIDSPPNLGILSVNYLTASDYVIVPVNASAFSVQGLSYLNEIVDGIKENANPNIKILGILLTRINKRAKISEVSKEILTTIAKELKTKVFNTTIRQSVLVENSHIEKENILKYAHNKGVAEDYISFVNELMERING